MSTPFNEYGPFAVGEICRIVAAEIHPALNGQECEIVAVGAHATSLLTGDKYAANRIRLQSGTLALMADFQLRRRKPPADSNERMFMQKWRDMDKAPQRVGEPA